MEQETGKKRKTSNEQYYTKASVAKECIKLIKETIKNSRTYQWIEPSAGTGAFLVRGCIAMDIEPKHKDIIKQDFLQFTPKSVPEKTLIYGNPPFGRQSSLAKRFIRRAYSFANIIAFILPLSFTKASMSNIFPDHYHCVESKVLEKDSFEVNGESYHVPCVFQIWIKKETKREREKPLVPEGFSYVKKEDAFDIAIRRVGVYAGKAFLKDSQSFNKQCFYFIKLEDKTKISKLVEEVNNHIFPSNTVGPRSLSKNEITSVLNLKLKD